MQRLQPRPSVQDAEARGIVAAHEFAAAQEIAAMRFLAAAHHLNRPAAGRARNQLGT